MDADEEVLSEYMEVSLRLRPSPPPPRYSHAEEPFPLMQLPNELLAGVAQRCKEGTRRQLERVDERAAAVTLAHGYIRRHRHELDIVLSVSESNAQPVIRVCGFGVAPHRAPAAVRWLLARHHRVTHLLLDVAVEFNNDWVERTREPLVSILDILLGSDRLQLTTVKIAARFGRGCDDVLASVACLVQRHAATIVDVILWPCDDDNGVAAEHEHVQLCQAVAACVDVQTFHVLVGDRDCLKTVERDCLPAFSQLRRLYYFDYSTTTGTLLDFDALPRPSKLEVLCCGRCKPTDGLSAMLPQRPDVVASLRHLCVIRFGADLPDGFLDAAPRLQTFTVASFVPSLGGCDPLTFGRSLVSQFFAAKGEPRLCFELIITLEEAGGDVSMKSAELLTAVHAAASDIAVACSDAKTVVLGCRAILKAAVDANPAAAAQIGRAFMCPEQANGADSPLYTSVVYAATAASQTPDFPDCAAAAPLYTALVAAAGGRVRLDTALADGAKQDVAFQVTRGDGADKRQLDIFVVNDDVVVND